MRWLSIVSAAAVAALLLLWLLGEDPGREGARDPAAAGASARTAAVAGATAEDGAASAAPAAIVGSVRGGPDGDPLAGARVALDGRVVRTDAAGRFRIGEVAPSARPRIEASHPGAFRAGQRGTPVSVTKAGPDGTFRIAGLPPGRYDLCRDVTSDDDRTVLHRLNAEPLEPGAMALELVGPR